MQDHVTRMRSGLRPGFNGILDAREDPDTGLELGLHSLAAGEVVRLARSGAEMAVVALSGRGELRVGEERLPFDRQDWREQGPSTAHVPAGIEVEVRAESDSELALVATENELTFEPRLIGPEQVETEHRGKGLLEDTCYRLVRCVFDRRSAPEAARLVLGEVVSMPGRWSSYPPHSHPQPEIYYYRFWPQHGYGHGEVGEQVYSLKHHDVLRIPGGRTHSQVAAPGYQMYYLWAIRHLPNQPYTGFEFDPQHSSLLD